MTEPSIEYEPAVASVQNWLKAKLSGVSVSTKVPASRPAKFVTVSASGGSPQSKVLEWRWVTVKCTDANELLTARLAEHALNLVRQMRGTSGVREVRLVGGPDSMPDPDANYECYQFTVALLLRARV
ncbi:hypothetical protein [Mycobacteroides abscessus]|uniref:hypothetical protein n=1 Tax=Mycobacteroides abscessus TaxID=36809 RepID=UPI00092664F9|nr:hypothetical protein [Mycobacteroides abscessus]SKS05153.1 Uncharacterised protein [Mycobacteroides abscessus subsp. abscessus]SHU53928.1 Uncharacterised protein [Mycobacteroides abscessus subsp. bolletii]SHW62624.1 Uncharacterised protein [Mycobacteroides abscessus subsp. bolletii]SHW90623.1 Uncharacterised protein [Mycobacteroides abscessus subsp. bolletii]SHX34814.1 Uncharacterised protein [Mycobacteroides abscessus subsp. bolletii]